MTKWVEKREQFTLALAAEQALWAPTSFPLSRGSFCRKLGALARHPSFKTCSAAKCRHCFRWQLVLACSSYTAHPASQARHQHQTSMPRSMNCMVTSQTKRMGASSSEATNTTRPGRCGLHPQVRNIRGRINADSSLGRVRIPARPSVRKPFQEDVVQKSMMAVPSISGESQNPWAAG